MGRYKYKIKEGIVKPKDAPNGLVQRIEKKHGPVDMENDFFSDNYDTYFKIDNTTKQGKVTHDIIKLGGFTSSLKALSNSVNKLTTVANSDEGENDEKIKDIAQELRDLFNEFRTHLRTNYPDQYERIISKLKEMSNTGGTAISTPGTGMQYTIPKAFTKKNFGPTFGYKLVPKKIKGSGLEVKQIFEKEKDSMETFQSKRIAAFDEIEEELNQLYTKLSNSKNETIKYYQSNPGSFKVFTPTDLVLSYISDINKLLTWK